MLRLLAEMGTFLRECESELVVSTALPLPCAPEALRRHHRHRLSQAPRAAPGAAASDSAVANWSGNAAAVGQYFVAKHKCCLSALSVWT